MVEAQARFALSLDAPAGPDGDESLYDVLGDDNAGSEFAAADRAHTLGRVRTVIEGLPSRTRAMVGMYYDEGLTLREIGAVFQVSEARVSQILGRTLLSIRARLETEVEAAIA
jgi:RNA polymerase sigma factor for flagellar operon FliA